MHGCRSTARKRAFRAELFGSVFAKAGQEVETAIGPPPHERLFDEQLHQIDYLLCIGIRRRAVTGIISAAKPTAGKA